MVLYKLYQDVREYTDKTAKTENPNYGKWFARPVHTGTKDTKALAKEVAYATTLTETDCVNVINSLVTYMTEAMQDAYAVKLNDFGIFKIGISTTGADSIDEFSISKNITGKHVNFQPAYTVDSATNVRTVTFLDGIRFKETPLNNIE